MKWKWNIWRCVKRRLFWIFFIKIWCFLKKCPSEIVVSNESHKQSCCNNLEWIGETVTKLQLKINNLEAIIKSKEMEMERILQKNGIFDETIKHSEETLGYFEAKINDFNRESHHVAKSDVLCVSRNSLIIHTDYLCLKWKFFRWSQIRTNRRKKYK